MLGLDPAVASTGRQPLPDYAGGVKQLRFSPYQENHGSLVAIAGKDYALIASDTRLSGYGYSIHTRDQPKLFKVRIFFVSSHSCFSHFVFLILFF